MYFITTKRMLEVCFSAHPNIQYRTCFSYNMLRITSHSIAKSIVDFIANSICGSISITQPVRTLWILSCKIRKSPLQYRERAFTKKAGAEQGMKAQKCKGIKGVKG